MENLSCLKGLWKFDKRLKLGRFNDYLWAARCDNNLINCMLKYSYHPFKCKYENIYKWEIGMYLPTKAGKCIGNM